MLGRACAKKLAVRRDHVGRLETVDRQAVLPRQPSEPAPEREPGHAGRGVDPDGDRQPERLRLVIQVAQRRACADVRDARLGIDANEVHPRKIDHHAALADGIARDVVAPAANREHQPVLAREVHRAHHVRRPGAACDERRTAVDHAVPDRAGLVVTGVAFAEQRSAHCAPQGFDPRGIDRSGSPVRSSDGDRAHSISRAIAPDSGLPSERVRHVPSPLSRREARPEGEGHRDDPIPLYVTFVTGTCPSGITLSPAHGKVGTRRVAVARLHSAQENFSVHRARVDAGIPFGPSPGRVRRCAMSARTADERVLPLCAPGRFPGKEGAPAPWPTRSARFGKRVGYSCRSASIGASCAALRAG